MRKRLLLIILCIPFMSGFLHSQPLAFPGAEGFGAYSTGGRGGAIYHVTNLNDSGPGSFRDAVSKPNKTVVFDIGGVIKINSSIKVASKITIAGQTAPGEGITIYGRSVSFSGSTNVIARYIRFHGSIEMPKGDCVVVIDNAENVILDHCSIEWGRWDNLHIKESKNITLQYCINGEAIDPQRFGALLEHPTNLTIHHCLWIDNHSRNPKAKAGIQFVNNVIYNWGVSGFVGGHSETNHYQDIINNYFIAGPNSSNSYLTMFLASDHVYHRGNYIDMNKDGLLNGQPITSEEFITTKATIESMPHNIPPVKVTIDSTLSILDNIVTQAGASLHRDSVDSRLINQLKSLGLKGKIIKTEAEVGGQGSLKTGESTKDSDQDGMPDTWEKEHHLNPNSPKDANLATANNGYTNLDDYLNSLTFQNHKNN